MFCRPVLEGDAGTVAVLYRAVTRWALLLKLLPLLVSLNFLLTSESSIIWWNF